MYFESVSALLHMDGHGPYVWAAYGITVVVVLMLLIGPRRQQQRILQQLGAEMRRQQRAADLVKSADTASQNTSTPSEEM